MIGSLCSGYGGLDLAVAAHYGMPVAWHVEYDKAPAKILDARFPGIPNHGDLTTVDWTQVEPVDILTAGFPCQPFSHAGSRLGERDPRHLWPYIAQAIATLRPHTVVLENVSGLLSIGDTFDEPNDRCVCGWPLRRGGECWSWADEGGLDDRLPCRDDDQGEGHPGGTGEGVRGTDSSTPGSDGEVGRGLDLERPRARGGSIPESSVALLESEAGRGRNGAAPGGGALGVGHDDAHDAAPTVDPGGVGAVRGTTSGDQATESSRPGTEGVDEGACPACGGPMDEPTVRSLYRHGMGTVLGTLARLGYDARWGVVRAADAGAPHGRARIFVVATDTGGEAVGLGTGLRAGQPRGVGRGRPDNNDPQTSLADASSQRHGGGEDGRGVGRVDGEDAVQARQRQRARAVPVDRGVEAWGQYAPAIARWEAVIGRPAPAPTEPTGKDGGRRLSARAVEWLMGLDDGWVTDIDLTRSQQLKALGNGVVPQQALLALSLLDPAQAVAA